MELLYGGEMVLGMAFCLAFFYWFFGGRQCGVCGGGFEEGGKKQCGMCRV